MVFAEALTEYLVDGLADALAASEASSPPMPLPVDRYLALSALQKAIRRGDEDLGLRAAMTVRIEGPQAIWRRLGIIAFEDIGVGAVDAVGWAAVVIGDKELRTRLGGEWKVMDFLVRTLCRSPKSRATDEITYLVLRDVMLAALRVDLPGLSLRRRIAAATDHTACVEDRALATWFSIGTNKITAPELAPVPGCIENTFDVLRDAGCPDTAVEIGRMGLKRTGCILAAMFPLLYRARSAADYPLEDDPFPVETRIGPVPSWVFDMHTRSGLAAFDLYRRRSERMRGFLAEHADPTANLRLETWGDARQHIIRTAPRPKFHSQGAVARFYCNSEHTPRDMNGVSPPESPPKNPDMYVRRYLFNWVLNLKSSRFKWHTTKNSPS